MFLDDDEIPKRRFRLFSPTLIAPLALGACVVMILELVTRL